MLDSRADRRAVLFDLDGVLVRTEQLKAEAHATAVKLLGGHVSPLLYRCHMGKAHEAVRSAFVAQAGIAPDLEKYSRLYQEAYRDLLRDRLAVVPGATELCQELSERGFLLGVVTSSRSWMTDYVLSKTRLDRFFDVQVSAEDVQTPKPAPDAYMLALQRLGVRPATAVAFEDSETGVEAAAKAGITVLAVRHDWNQGHDFSKAVAEFSALRNVALIVAAIESILVPAEV